MNLRFRAPEYHSDTHFAEVGYRLEGSTPSGWRIEREGRPHLELGPGYRLLRTRSCGICSTDLSRHLLPFPLPQITGHELVAEDEEGRRFVVEINASHQARHEAPCAFCQRDLGHHCPERIVLGIHDLPGGFGPYVLAPVGAVIEIPDALPTASAVLIEPFAAALHAVERVAPRPGDRIAVLGPRRLGLLVVAALAAHRHAQGVDFQIVAISRHASLLTLAESLGADTSVQLTRHAGEREDDEAMRAGRADVVIDTTGSAEGVLVALRLAEREVHLKSTHGQPSAGLAHLTELVVDEISLGPLPETAQAGRTRLDSLARPIGRERATVGWLSQSDPPAWLDAHAELRRSRSAQALLRQLESDARDGLGRADVVVVDDAEQVDEALRPFADREAGAVRPLGEIWISAAGAGASVSPLLVAIREGGLRLSSSRCGDFRTALGLMAEDPSLRGLGERFVTHHFPASRIEQAFEVARSPDCIKAVIEHARASHGPGR
jgi:threonine dehydrogenase-like Zn-dependent dehydrogenase